MCSSILKSPHRTNSERKDLVRFWSPSSESRVCSWTAVSDLEDVSVEICLLLHHSCEFHFDTHHKSPPRQVPTGALVNYPDRQTGREEGTRNSLATVNTELQITVQFAGRSLTLYLSQQRLLPKWNSALGFLLLQSDRVTIFRNSIVRRNVIVERDNLITRKGANSPKTVQEMTRNSAILAGG